MVPGARPLIDIGNKYNERKVISFIVKDNTGRTKAGLPYLFNYPVHISNAYILPVVFNNKIYNLPRIILVANIN